MTGFTPGGPEASRDRPAEHDAGTRFRARAARGDAARGLRPRDELDRAHARAGGARSDRNPGLAGVAGGGRGR